MVDQSRYVGNVGSLKTDLDQAAAKLTEIGGKNTISKKEINELSTILNHVNSNLDPTFWADKKLAPEDMNVTIEKALKALALFQTATTKNVDQAIISLVSSLKSTLNAFDQNLRNLKDHKIGRRVEKTGESKHA